MATFSDPATGTKFPESLSAPGFNEPVQFFAAGVRDKKVAIVTVKVYGVALHVPRGKIVDSLAGFKGISGGKLAKDEKFYKALEEATFEKCLTMCFVRAISGQQFSNGLRENMEPRLKKKGVGLEPLEKFLAAFSGIQLETGTRIYLSLASPASTHVTIVNASDVPENLTIPEGAKSTVIESADLLSSLNQVYFGPDSVSPSLKKAIAESFEKSG